MTGAASKRSTICFEPMLHRALRVKSAATGRTVSDIVNDAVRDSLAEDADDLAVIEARKGESARPFDAFVSHQRARGKA